MLPPPFSDSVRVLPSADSAHFSIAGCQLALPQKSPTLAHTASTDAAEVPLMLDSTAAAGATVRTSNDIPSAGLHIFISFLPDAFLFFAMNGRMEFDHREKVSRQVGLRHWITEKPVPVRQILAWLRKWATMPPAVAATGGIPAGERFTKLVARSGYSAASTSGCRGRPSRSQTSTSASARQSISA